MLLISAKQVTAGYRSHGPVFHGLSLDIKSGENTSILGPSGSGKSTLLKILAGVKRPLAGAVSFTAVAGRPLRPGLMFQQPMLLPWLTVSENISLGARYHNSGDRQQDTAALIGDVGLAGLADRRPSELSGGQRQRAALARTMMHQPDVLLLDEPFSSLDVELRNSLRYLVLKQTTERNIPIVLVTHQPDEATSFGGRVLNMADMVQDAAVTSFSHSNERAHV